MLDGGRYAHTLPCLPGERCTGRDADGRPVAVVRSPHGVHFCPVHTGRGGPCPVYSSGAVRFGRAMAAPVVRDYASDPAAGPRRQDGAVRADVARSGAAVAAVVAYHAGVPGVRGGLLGVDVFFVLSGYLVTGLLIAEWAATGRIGRTGPPRVMLVGDSVAWSFVAPWRAARPGTRTPGSGGSTRCCRRRRAWLRRPAAAPADPMRVPDLP